MREAKKIIRKTMVTRNKFTVQSIQVEPAKTLNVRNQMSIIGSTADYMEDQEFGAIKTKGGKKGVPIATSYSSGEGQQAQPRRRLPKLQNQLANIQLKRKRRKASTRKQQLIFSVQDAVDTGRKFTYLDLGRRQGIFRVVGGKKNTKRGWPQGAKLKMVWDLTRQSVVIPRKPWLSPAVDIAVKTVPETYKKALEFQLKRLGLFR